MPSSLLATPFPLLLAPAESLLVLDYVTGHPRDSPRTAIQALHMGINTYYRCLASLESLGLIAIERAPGGIRTRQTLVTVKGREVLSALGPIAATLADSKAGLEWELGHRPPLKGSARAGEVFCRLIEDAQRRGDLKGLRRLEREATKWGRPGEAGLAFTIQAFLSGEREAALERGGPALEEIRKEGNTRSLRKALSVMAAVSEYGGKPRAAIAMTLELRTKARAAKDAAMEAEASQELGFLKARRDQISDAAREMRRALAVAEKGSLMDLQARILSNLCLVEFLVEPDRGIPAAQQALRVARESGARIALARVQTNRALMLAWAGDEVGSRHAMREARRELAKGGEEKGLRALGLWGEMVERVLETPAKMTSLELRREVLEYLKAAAPTAPMPNQAEAAGRTT